VSEHCGWEEEDIICFCETEELL